MKRTWDTERAKHLLTEEGRSNEEVAEMVGVSTSALVAWKRKEGLTVPRRPRRASSHTAGDKQSEHYTTEEVKAVANEARSRGLTYGELVAGKENRVEVNVPRGVTPCRAQELEREVFPPEDDAVDLHFVLNDEEVYLRAASGTRAVKLLETMAQILAKGAR